MPLSTTRRRSPRASIPSATEKQLGVVGAGAIAALLWALSRRHTCAPCSTVPPGGCPGTTVSTSGDLVFNSVDEWQYATMAQAQCGPWVPPRIRATLGLYSPSLVPWKRLGSFVAAGPPTSLQLDFSDPSAFAYGSCEDLGVLGQIGAFAAPTAYWLLFFVDTAVMPTTPAAGPWPFAASPPAGVVVNTTYPGVPVGWVNFNAAIAGVNGSCVSYTDYAAAFDPWGYANPSVVHYAQASPVPPWWAMGGGAGGLPGVDVGVVGRPDFPLIAGHTYAVCAVPWFTTDIMTPSYLEGGLAPVMCTGAAYATGADGGAHAAGTGFEDWPAFAGLTPSAGGHSGILNPLSHFSIPYLQGLFNLTSPDDPPDVLANYPFYQGYNYPGGSIVDPVPAVGAPPAAHYRMTGQRMHLSVRQVQLDVIC